MTNGELVSRIVNDVRALNKDEHISRRHILKIAQNQAKFLLSQKLRDRTLYREDSLFRTLKCFALKKDNVVKCDVVEFRKCGSVMRSKEKLPELIYSRYGGSIISVMTIDGMEEFLPISARKYLLQKKRAFSKFLTKKYYYVRDGYLYLPDTDIEAVDVVLLTLHEDKVEELSGCGECDGCKSIWDYEFIISDKLSEVVIQQTLNEVLQTFRRFAIDENPNLDSNQKSQTIV